MPTISVNLPAGAYTITVEPGILDRLGETVQSVAPHGRALLAVDAAIAQTHGIKVERSLRQAGYDLAIVHVTASETHKTMQAVQRIHGVMLAQRLERGSPVIAMGGGIVGDVAGFAAATYLRGVPLIQVPTTLLAMVDAAIGGKTGVNAPLPEGGMGKNLIGAFWQPRTVVADVQTLSTLDRRHVRCGLAECIKHAMIADAGLLDAIQDGLQSFLEHDVQALTRLIARSAAVKAEIVQSDEREAGRRALLNLGHTFAHVIEPIASLQLQHGEAVAIGLCAAAQTAVLLGACDGGYARKVRDVIAQVGLPTQLSQSVKVGDLMNAMAYDKKIVDGRMRIILPVGSGCAQIAEHVPSELIEQAWQHVGAR